jgi:hypothetical protein
VKSGKLISAIALLVALAIPVSLAAQEHPTKHHQYKLVDIGTFGGPNSSVNPNFLTQAGNRVISDQGTVAGVGDTSAARPSLLLRRLLLP